MFSLSHFKVLQGLPSIQALPVMALAYLLVHGISFLMYKTSPPFCCRQAELLTVTSESHARLSLCLCTCSSAIIAFPFSSSRPDLSSLLHSSTRRPVCSCSTLPLIPDHLSREHARWTLTPRHLSQCLGSPEWALSKHLWDWLCQSVFIGSEWAWY